MSNDKKTLGVTKGNAAAFEKLVAIGRFGAELDAAKFAMAYAIKSGVTQGSTESGDTKWNVGSVDPDGSVRALIETLYPEVTEPYRFVEHLMNEGIRLLSARFADGFDVYDILFTASPRSA